MIRKIKMIEDSVFLDLRIIDVIRRKGFRPQVVGCLLKNKKILFVFKKKYHLWQLPQGGVNNQEDLQRAVLREMKEELGETFLKKSQIGNFIIRKDKIIFPKEKWGSRVLKTDKGEDVLMKGKAYFFIPIKIYEDKLNIKKTEFDDYKWFGYQDAMGVAEKISQKKKSRIIIKTLIALKKRKIL